MIGQYLTLKTIRDRQTLSFCENEKKIAKTLETNCWLSACNPNKIIVIYYEALFEPYVLAHIIKEYRMRREREEK